MALKATSVLLKEHVDTGNVPLDTFTVHSTSIDPQQLRDGEVIVELLYLSVDPYLRFRMHSKSAHDEIHGGYKPGQVLDSGGVGLIKASKTPAYAEGDIVSGSLPWSTYSVLDHKAQGALRKVDRNLVGKVPLSYLLGTLGMPGLTAYGGIKKVTKPKAGEVAFVSGAAGAVGLVAGQLLKHVYGCIVIGSAGSEEKVKLLKDLGFDHAFNYKTTDTTAALAAAAPDGIDIYFDNVGGPTLDAALNAARVGARFALCGGISQYEVPPEEVYGIKNLFKAIPNRIKLEGVLVTDYYKDLGAEFDKNMAEYVQSGKVNVVEHVTEGIESAGTAFVDMMKGGNVGKAVIKVCKGDPFLVKQ